jgi:hypothetical protein
VSESATTRQGRQLYQTMGANMASEYGQRAASFQSTLDGDAAVNQFEGIKQSLGSVSYSDFTQWMRASEQAHAAINDPKGIFFRVPRTVRDKFNEQADQYLALAALRGNTVRNPGELTAAVAPAAPEKFAPWQKYLEGSAFPGGKVTISPQTMGQAKEISAASATRGVMPAVVAATMDVATDTPQNPNDTAATISVYLNKYGGDYSKAVAAYFMGPSKLNDTIRLEGSGWAAALPPEVQAKVGAVLQKSGSEPSNAVPTQGLPAVDPAEPVDKTPVRLSSKSPLVEAFNKLTWEQQDHVINEDVRYTHMKMETAMRAEALAENEKAKAQEAIMDRAVAEVYDPAANGAFDPKKYANDPTLASHQKHWVEDLYTSRIRQLREPRENRATYEALGADMIAADNDPDRAPSMDPARAALATGRINIDEYNRLQQTYKMMGDSEGRSFVHAYAAQKRKIRSDIEKSTQFFMNPAGASEAWGNVERYADAAMDDARAKDINPRNLLIPGPDYVFRPEVIASATAGARGSRADKAAQVSKKAVVNVGDTQDGYKFKGGDPANAANWEKVK